MDIRRLGMPSREAALFLLENARVAMIPGAEFGPHGEGYLRISYAVTEERIEQGMQRIADTVSRL